MSQDVSCLYSIFRNPSTTETRTYPFLPPHGRDLEPEGELAVLGDPIQSVIRDDRTTSRRNLEALENAIATGAIEIKQTAAPILLDAETGQSKMVRIRDGVLVLDDPCWESAAGSESGSA